MQTSSGNNNLVFRVPSTTILLMRIRSPLLLIAIAICSLTIGCRTTATPFRYSPASGSSVANAVAIYGVTNETLLVEAQENWIRERYPSAAGFKRELAFDPITSPPDAIAGWVHERVEFIEQHRPTNAVFFAYDASILKPPAEDLTLLHRCLSLIQSHEIRRGIATGALRQSLIRNGWVDGETLFFTETSATAFLSVYRPALTLLPAASPAPWEIRFTLQNGALADFCLTKGAEK